MHAVRIVLLRHANQEGGNKPISIALRHVLTAVVNLFRYGVGHGVSTRNTSVLRCLIFCAQVLPVDYVADRKTGNGSKKSAGKTPATMACERWANVE